MFGLIGRKCRLAQGFMARLRHDVRGNTLAIVAASLIPLAGMVGGGIDLSRMYMTKTRLQHACDAGALAGRKAMGAGTWAQTSPNPGNTADTFFKANFGTGSYGSTNLTSSFTENAGKVSGTASAILPMTLIRVLGFTTQTLAVTCSAEMRLPNTDVMFVLDNTGSMGSKAVATDPDTKIDSLKTAVKCFYEIVARLDTDANCTTGTPSGGTGNQVQIRFGFVPYSTDVNVGKLLPPDYFANTWKYQSREPVWTNTTSSQWVQQGNPTVTTNNISQNNVPSSSCNDAAADAAGYNSNADSYSNNNNTKTNTTVQTHVTGWSSANGGTCTGTQTKTITVYNKQNVTSKTFNQWHYGQITTDISGLKNGSQWNSAYSITAPIGSSGTPKTLTWDGCIEERQTVAATSYDPRPKDANDLNIDMVPSTSDSTTQWGPTMPGLLYARSVQSSWSQATTADQYSTADFYQGFNYFCPAESKKLQAWPDASDFDTYVDSLYPTGNTYHDIGMLWGARLMSPTGIFKTENAYTPQGGEIQRNMIFMTDGDAVSAPCDYTAYGVAWYDRRTTANVGTASNCPNEQSQMDDQINARLDALCTQVKNMNITLWVISFGSGSNTTTESRLAACASTGRYFAARDSKTLQQTFKSIADQISQLRLTT